MRTDHDDLSAPSLCTCAQVSDQGVEECQDTTLVNGESPSTCRASVTNDTRFRENVGLRESEQPLGTTASPQDRLPACCASSLAAAMGDLQAMLGERKRLEEVIRSQSERLRCLEERDLEHNVLWPVFLAIIRLIDKRRAHLHPFRMKHEAYLAAGQHEHAALVASLQAMIQSECVELTNVLACLGVEEFQGANDVFDPSTQHVVLVAATEIPTDFMKIKERLYSGYRRCGRVVRPELVVAYGKALRQP